jgi:hypothetical protein
MFYDRCEGRELKVMFENGKKNGSFLAHKISQGKEKPLKMKQILEQMKVEGKTHQDI